MTEPIPLRRTTGDPLLDGHNTALAAIEAAITRRRDLAEHLEALTEATQAVLEAAEHFEACSVAEVLPAQEALLQAVRDWRDIKARRP